MNIRDAVEADVDAMATLWLKTALFAYAHIFPSEAPAPTQRQNAAFIRGDFDDARGHGFVAEDGELVGMVMSGTWPGEPAIGRFHRMYVEPSRWRLGIGRKLHDRAVAALAHSGFATARLWVLRDNAPARAFYEQCGWKQTGEIAVVYGNVIDVQYERALSA